MVKNFILFLLALNQIFYIFIFILFLMINVYIYEILLNMIITKNAITSISFIISELFCLKPHNTNIEI